ncbi:MAG: tyrosine--tRNA ligase [Verrucomicrobiota bacterium]
MATVQEQMSVLTRGVTKIHSVEELEAKIKSGRPLRVKLGFDPSSPNLHLGHALILDKIAEFQRFGHTAVIIIGDYTARVGDPTGRSKTRPALDPAEIDANAKTYTNQVFTILDSTRTEIRYNGEWFDKFSFADVLKLNAQITVAQLLEREDFKKRYTDGQSITLMEFQYPLMQGYDSVMIRADLELGGNDQLFNNLVGRDLQKVAGQEPQVVMVLPILVGTDGVQKMSKSLDNAIGIMEPASEMFGKTMSISDDAMREWIALLAPYYKLPSPLPEHPMECKKALATAIAARYWGKDAAQKAREDFEMKFSKRDLDQAEIPIVAVSESSIWIVKLLQEIGAAPSGAEARRLISQGAIKINNEKIADPNAQIKIEGNVILQSGKKFFARLETAKF